MSMSDLIKSPVFKALTQPQMFAGVTYSYFIINAVVTTEAFLITRSFWAFAVALGRPCDWLSRLPARAAHLRSVADQGVALPARSELSVLAL